MTTSRFIGYEKHFFSIDATEDDPKLYPITNRLLRERKPTYPPYISVLTIHLKKDSSVANEFEETKRIFCTQMSELITPIALDGREVKNRRYELLGSNPECFCLVFELVKYSRLQLLIDLWIGTLCEKYALKKSQSESELRLVSDDGVVVGRICNASMLQKKLHATLLTSFDLKRSNKKVYKQYRKADDRLAYLISHYGEL